MGSDLVALKMAKEDPSMERTIKLQLKLTLRSATFASRTLDLILKSFCCSSSVDNSRFSRICSSLNVGLSGFRARPGVPGTFKALLSLGLMGTAVESWSLLIYPKPISPGCDGADIFLSPSPAGSIGEWMLVASANRGVLGALPSDDVDDDESEDVDRMGVKFKAAGRFLSSVGFMATRADSPSKEKDTQASGSDDSL